MYRKLSLFLAALAVATVVVPPARASENDRTTPLRYQQQQEQEQQQEDGFVSVETGVSVLCRIIRVDVDYGQGPAEEAYIPPGDATLDDDYSDDNSYVCLGDTPDGVDLAYGIVLPPDILQELEKSTSPPSSPRLLIISRAFVDHRSTTIRIASDAEISVVESAGSSNWGFQRRLAKKTGTSRVLVLRVTYRGTSPVITGTQLAGRIFGLGSAAESVNLSSQLWACSFGKLNLVPAENSDRIQDGVTEISITEKVDGDFSVRQLENLVVDKANRIFGGLSTQFDHVVLVLPKGFVYGGRAYLAYGYLGGARTVFEDEWAGRISALAHEVGHNFNLGHAGKGSMPYGDLVGYMGYGIAQVGSPAMCYNPQKNWSLGWYKDRALSLTMTELPWGGNLAAYVDYDLTQSNQYVLINVGNSVPRLFIQYNRAKNMNTETRAERDKVVIVQDKGNPQSWFVSSIMVDDDTVSSIFRYNKFDGESDLVIEVCAATRGPPDLVRLSAHLDDGTQSSACNDDLQPTTCRDSSELFFIAQKDRYKSCRWLSRNFKRWGKRLCVPGQEAFDVCTATCGRCTEGCSDSSTGTFFVNDNLLYKSCSWLSTRERRQEQLCYEGNDAYELCSQTCGTCS